MVHTVHLVYCVSGIETIELLPVAIRYSVHLVYCVSGIETLYEPFSQQGANVTFI